MIKNKHNYNKALVIVCKFIKYTYIMLCYKLAIAKDAIKIYYYSFFYFFSLPKSIILDKKP